MTKYLPIRFWAWLGAMLVSGFVAGSTLAEVVRLQGATTLEKILTPQKAALENTSGAKLEIVGNGAGRGLVNLSSGQAEIAMVAGSLKGVADAMNREKAGSVEIGDLKETALSGVKLAFITHPSAGVKSLTDEQVRSVLTGKVTNWKDVGGADQPVKVVISFAGDGARVTVEEKVLKGEAFAKGAVVRNSAKDLALVVSQLPGACTFLSSKNAEGNVTTVATESEVVLPLLLVTKGEPAGDVKKVVEAVKAVVK